MKRLLLAAIAQKSAEALGSGTTDLSLTHNIAQTTADVAAKAAVTSLVSAWLVALPLGTLTSGTKDFRAAKKNLADILTASPSLPTASSLLDDALATASALLHRAAPLTPGGSGDSGSGSGFIDRAQALDHASHDTASLAKAAAVKAAPALARTRTTRLLAQSQLSLADELTRSPLTAQTGLGPDSLSKLWLSRADADVRHLHRTLHGSTRLLDQDFYRWPATGAQLAFPGDPRAPLDAILNCRCSLGFVFTSAAAVAESVFALGSSTPLAASFTPLAASIHDLPRSGESGSARNIVQVEGANGNGAISPSPIALDSVTAFARLPFREDLHPRGHDGKFIEKFGWVRVFGELGRGPSGHGRRGQVVKITPDPSPSRRGDPIVTVRFPIHGGDEWVERELHASQLESADPPVARLDRPLQRMAESVDAFTPAFLMPPPDAPSPDSFGTYYYDVSYAVDHEAMQRGDYKISRVIVQAPDETTANLHAAQMVGHRGIPTATKLVRFEPDAPATLPEKPKVAGVLDEAVPDEGYDKLFTGGLVPSDFPYGVYPRDIHRNAEYVARFPGSSPRFSLEWTPEEQAQARQALAEQVRLNEPTTRMPMRSFRSFLADGTLRNQWETGSTGAATGKTKKYEPIRGNAETDHFGVPEDAPPEARPVYGYFASGTKADVLDMQDEADRQEALSYLPVSKQPKDDGSPSDYDQMLTNPDDWYISITPSRLNAGEGEYHSVTTADAIATRAAVIDGYFDEMRQHGFYPIGDGNGGINWDNVGAYANSQYAANSYGDVEVQLKREILDASTVTGGDSIDGRLMGGPARLVESADPRVPIGMVAYKTAYQQGKYGDYVEVQYHRHPTLADDVAQVFFTGVKPPRAVTQQLDQLGIKWQWKSTPKLSRDKKVPVDEILLKGTNQLAPGASEKERLALLRRLP